MWNKADDLAQWASDEYARGQQDARNGMPPTPERTDRNGVYLAGYAKAQREKEQSK